MSASICTSIPRISGSRSAICNFIYVSTARCYSKLSSSDCTVVLKEDHNNNCAWYVTLPVWCFFIYEPPCLRIVALYGTSHLKVFLWLLLVSAGTYCNLRYFCDFSFNNMLNYFYKEIWRPVASTLQFVDAWLCFGDQLRLMVRKRFVWCYSVCLEKIGYNGLSKHW